jgi:protein TonB
MTSTPVALPPSAADRLGLALLVAAAMHGFVILGVSFDAEKLGRKARAHALDIVLVHSKSEAPDQADYLAQENQLGGGNVQEKVRPSSPFPNARPIQERGTAAETRDAAAPRPEPDRPRGAVVTEGESRREARAENRQPRPDLQQPTAEELMQRSLEAARLSAEIRQRQEAYAQMPRQEWVTANTRKYDTAAYEESWREKVERIGNLNYPEEARRRRLTGALILDVAIRPDGSLASVKVQRSSGNRVLDEGALRIVRLAAPFAPFSDSMRKRMDLLHIVRTWQFEDDSRLQTF